MATQSKEYQREYRAKNLERVRESARRWYHNHKDQVKQIRDDWRNRNKDRHCASSAKRRARKLNATPPWLSKEQYGLIQDQYECAQLLGLTVDHIIPLLGKQVCGLHVPWNLQLLTHSENCSKHNKIMEI